MDIYSHFLPGLQQEALRKIDDALRKAISCAIRWYCA